MCNFAKVLLFIGIATLGIVLYGMFASQASADTLTPEPAEEYMYEDCISSGLFTDMIVDLEGRMAANGEVMSGNVFVIVFPDNTFGLFVYLDLIDGPDTVCLLDTGAFEASQPFEMPV